MMNPWHAVEVGDDAPEFINGIIEIPRGSKNKYELCKKTGMLMLDRVLYTSMRYPVNYGFIPQTYCDDKDPLDILVISQEVIHPMCLVPCRVIGVMQMIDKGEGDDKVIAVPVEDPAFENIKSIDDLPQTLINEIGGFFADYKKLEKKKVEITGFFGKERALEIVKEAIELYKETFGEKVK